MTDTAVSAPEDTAPEGTARNGAAPTDADPGRTRAAARRVPLPIPDVRVDDAFWTPRRELVRTVTLRQQERQLRSGGQFAALRLTWQPGDEPVPHIFWESDVAKWIEAASYCLARTADEQLEASVDEAIDLLAGAQQDDGYLNVYYTVVEPGRRFTDLRDGHELYCAGHLIEAGVAHFAATGSTRLLDVVVRYADLIDREFGPGGSCEGGYDGHEEIELALVKLHRATGQDRYLELSRRLVAARGRQPFYFDREEQRRGTPGYFAGTFPQRPHEPVRFREYNQSHQPVTEQADAVGHSVRAMYLYSAMADLAAAGDEQLQRACDRLWQSVTGRKMYVTGGLGADPGIEGFAGDYDLPNSGAYAETCAAIGLVLWAQRMANATGDAQHVDVLERALYNGVLAGASADGTSYFYGNPLASDGSVARREWFGVACCPPNLARLLSSLEHYIYAQSRDEAVVHLYVSGTARFDVGGATLSLTQRSDHPTDGRVDIEIDEVAADGEISLALRIPGWCHRPALALNDVPVDLDEVLDRGYARLTRRWRSGDRIALDLPMRPHRVWADPRVAADAGRVALQRGPLVFCLEGVDHAGPVHTLTLPRAAGLQDGPDDLTGTVAVTATGEAERPAGVDNALYPDLPPTRVPAGLRAVPYFSWANRGPSDMAVWIREDPCC